jgi:hypothetical protein
MLFLFKFLSVRPSIAAVESNPHSLRGTHQQVDVIGTTPYVESSMEAAKQNIDWAITRALQLDKHVDFHLDYNLDSNKEPLVWHVLQTLQQRNWTAHSTDKRVMLGHCTRLTLLTETEWNRLAAEINENKLPVSFVGLPTSDIYMASAGNCDSRPPQDRPRGTLQVLEMIRKHGLDAVIGVKQCRQLIYTVGSAGSFVAGLSWCWRLPGWESGGC